MHTVAGGEILDAHPKKHRRFKDDVVTSLEARDAGLIDDVAPGSCACARSPLHRPASLPERWTCLWIRWKSLWTIYAKPG